MSSLLDDIKDRDAQTEPITDPQYLPLGQSGTKYDHARRLRNNYHLDDYTLAMGDRHFLLEMVRDFMRASSGESEPGWLRELRSKVARYENAEARAKELVRGSPVDWSTDAAAQEPDGWWKYTSQNNRDVLMAAIASLRASSGESGSPLDAARREVDEATAHLTEEQWDAAVDEAIKDSRTRYTNSATHSESEVDLGSGSPGEPE